jgi:hypothetical protein
MRETPLPHNANQLRADIDGLVKVSERLKQAAAMNAEQAKILARRIEEARRELSPQKAAPECML